MRALIGLAAAALSLSGCETAFVGRAPAGRFELVEVNGRALPQVRRSEERCSVTVTGGHLELDALARRFQMRIRESSSCSAAASVVLSVSGSYLRRDGRVTLEAERGAAAGQSWTATESGNSIALSHEGTRLRFRQAERPRR
jgi:hypothetical protein